MAGAEQRKSPTKNKRGGGLSIPVKGGGGILIVGGTLIALGAAFLFRRFRANKRRPPPPPPSLPNPVDEIHGKLANDVAKAKVLSDGCDPRIGLQSILLPIHQESQDLAVAADRFVSEIDHTTVIEDVVEKIEFKKVEEVNVVEKIEFKEVEEVKEAEEVEEKHDKEEHETLAMESEEETPELPFDETGSSSVESSVAAVWPADMMEQEEESPVMEMKETTEAEKDCFPEVMKLKVKANLENLDVMPMMKMSEKNQHYKGFIMLLALLVAFGLLFCKDAVFSKIN